MDIDDLLDMESADDGEPCPSCGAGFSDEHALDCEYDDEEDDQYINNDD